jgi:hypothetical protein
MRREVAVHTVGMQTNRCLHTNRGVRAPALTTNVLRRRASVNLFTHTTPAMVVWCSRASVDNKRPSTKVVCVTASRCANKSLFAHQPWCSRTRSDHKRPSSKVVCGTALMLTPSIMALPGSRLSVQVEEGTLGRLRLRGTFVSTSSFL